MNTKREFIIICDGDISSSNGTEPTVTTSTDRFSNRTVLAENNENAEIAGPIESRNNNIIHKTMKDIEKDDNLELSPNELSVFINAATKAREKLENRPLKTKIMVEEDLEEKRKLYSVIKLKLKLPTHYSIIANFHFNEKISDVYQFCSEIFPSTVSSSYSASLNPEYPFRLKSIRPTKLWEPYDTKDTLFDLGFYPATVLLLIFEHPNQAILSESILKEKLKLPPKSSTEENKEICINENTEKDLLNQSSSSKINASSIAHIEKGQLGSSKEPNISSNEGQKKSNRTQEPPKWLRGILKK